MRKQSKMERNNFNLHLYEHSLKDFCNNDLRIIHKGSKYFFRSKKENFLFREVVVPGKKEKLPLIVIFLICDEIYAEIEDLRKDNEVF